MKIIKVAINIEDIDIPELKTESGDIAVGFTKDTYKLIEELEISKEKAQSIMFTAITKIFTESNIIEGEIDNA